MVRGVIKKRHASDSSKSTNEPPRKRKASAATENNDPPTSTHRQKVIADSSVVDPNVVTEEKSERKVRKEEGPVKEGNDQSSCTMSTSKSRRKKIDFLAKDKKTFDEIVKAHRTLYWNRRDFGGANADGELKTWMKGHTFYALKYHPKYIEKGDNKRTENTLGCCSCGTKSKKFCAECSLLMMYPVAVCKGCRDEHSNRSF